MASPQSTFEKSTLLGNRRTIAFKRRGTILLSAILAALWFPLCGSLSALEGVLPPAHSGNPFVWHAESKIPFPARIAGNDLKKISFPKLTFAERLPAPLLAAEEIALPWLPSEIDPLAPPDGMPVVGDPSGLAMLEQAVGNGIVVGEVSDATTLNPVVGALVELLGTGRTVETNAQGRFEFKSLPPGTFNIEASQLGYFSDKTVVTVIDGSPSEVRFGLRTRPTDESANEFTLEEETIVGEYQGDSAGDFNLELAIDSPNISAGLSKEDFSRTGASDAGAAVSKIAGANIVGGKYAVVRGLGDRYSNTLFNGALIPSADPSKKAVQLDLFPSDLLESVAITKLFLPELPAEFAGGTVQIQTLRLPDKPIVEFSFGTKWLAERPSGGFLGDSTTNTKFNKIEFPGLPTGFEKPNGFTGSVADSLALHRSAPMRASSVDDELATSFSMVLGNTFELTEGVKLGAVFALTRDTENSYEDQTLGRGYRPDDPKTPGVVDAFLDNRSRSEDFERELTFGMMTGLSLELGDQHDIGFTYFFNESFTDGYVKTSDGLSSSQPPILVANPYGVTDPNTGEIVRAFAQPGFAADFFEPLQRSLDIKQFNGNHVIYGEKGRGGTFSWMVSDATAIEDRPHSRTYTYVPLDFSNADTILPVISNPSQFRPDFPQYDSAGDPILANGFAEVEIFRESLSTTDVGENRRADVSLPYYFEDDSDDRVGLRFGYNTSDRKREVRGRFFTYDFTRINDDLMIEDSLGNYQGNFGNQFHQNFNTGFYPNDPTRPIFGGSGIRINDFSGNGFTVRNIDAATSIESMYVGADIVLDGWTLSGGTRLESETRSYQILPGLNPALIANPVPVVTEEDAILPGLVLTKTIGDDDDFVFTAGWSRTVARPTFYEFAPAFIVDQATGDTTRGNPDLQNSSITNYDLRVDWKVDQDTNIGVGLFRKSIKDPIVDAFDPVLNAQSWINGDSGTLDGIEIEANTILAERYRLGGNYTFIKSNLEYTLGTSQQSTGFTGQPSHILNLFAGYDDKERGISANFVYNFTGSYLSAAPATANTPGIMEESYQSLDFIFQKSFKAWDCDGKVTLGIRNILDSTRRQFYDGTNLTFREGKPGRSFSISCEMNF